MSAAQWGSLAQYQGMNLQLGVLPPGGDVVGSRHHQRVEGDEREDHSYLFLEPLVTQRGLHAVELLATRLPSLSESRLVLLDKLMQQEQTTADLASLLIPASEAMTHAAVTTTHALTIHNNKSLKEMVEFQ